MRSCFFIICCSCLLTTAAGQNYQGLSADPTAGLYSIHLNPASSSFYPYSYQINILAGHFFMENNYASASNSSIISLLKNYNDLDIATHPNQITDSGASAQLVFDESGKKKFGAISSTVLWPSYLWERNKKEKTGLYARTRIEGSFYKLPAALGYYEVAAVRNSPTTIGPFSASYLSWTDLGVHFSRIMVDDNYETTSAGINARLVIPHESARFELLDDLVFNRQDSVFSGSGLLSSSQYTFFETGGFRPRATGIGLATDIGYMTATERESYGFALLDFGFAYVSSGAEAYDIVSDTIITYNNGGLSDPSDLSEVLTDLDAQLDPQISRLVTENSSYMMGLPTALSIQYHRRLNDSWSLSGLLVQRVPVFPHAVRRPNSVSLIPRFRKDQLNIALPISLFEYKEASLGLSLKYWFLSAGTDNLLSFIKQNRFTGTDFYVAIQWYPFKEIRKDNSVRCFKF